MRIVRHYRNAPQKAKGAVIALGNFDGVHRGHQALIAEAGRIAQSAQCLAIAPDKLCPITSNLLQILSQRREQIADAVQIEIGECLLKAQVPNFSDTPSIGALCCSN